LKDTGEGSGTFVRVDRPLILSNGFLIAFGESHMVVQIQKVRGDQMGETKTKLSLKFLDGPKAQESFTFWPNIKEIKIGRMSDCEIKINDNGLSRVQCISRMTLRRIGSSMTGLGLINAALTERGSMLMISSGFMTKWCSRLVITYFKLDYKSLKKIDMMIRI